MENLDRLTDAIGRRLFVELEASGRHVHVTEAQAQQLFGHGLTPKRPLSQPGQYLAEERVTVTGPKGSLERVACWVPSERRPRWRYPGPTPWPWVSSRRCGSPGTSAARHR